VQAIIIGAGISGLTLSTQIAPFYDEVLIIDGNADQLGQKSRRGALQGKHLHVLLRKGQDILFELFPELLPKFQEDCPVIDWAQDTRWEYVGGVFPQYPSGVKTYSFSRGYLECRLFETVSKIKNIKIISQKVTGFISDNREILGVRYTGGESIAARVFLCAGSYFPLETYLADSGISGLNKTEKNINITYSSSVVPTPENANSKYKQYYSQLIPPFSNVGFVKTQIENKKSFSTSIEYMKGANKTSTRDSAVLTRKNTFRRTIPKLKGLIVLGDSLCSLNPVYGQGMTVAMMQVLEISKHINLDDSALQKRVSRVNLSAWILSCMAFQTKDNFISKYLMAFYNEAQIKKKFHLNFLRVLHLEVSLIKIIKIRLLVDVIYSLLKEKKI
jgi:hypothetical protein